MRGQAAELGIGKIFVGLLHRFETLNDDAEVEIFMNCVLTLMFHRTRALAHAPLFPLPRSFTHAPHTHTPHTHTHTAHTAHINDAAKAREQMASSEVVESVIKVMAAYSSGFPEVRYLCIGTLAFLALDSALATDDVLRLIGQYTDEMDPQVRATTLCARHDTTRHDTHR